MTAVGMYGHGTFREGESELRTSCVAVLGGEGELWASCVAVLGGEGELGAFGVVVLGGIGIGVIVVITYWPEGWEVVGER